jgi:hypothetical protein
VVHSAVLALVEDPEDPAVPAPVVPVAVVVREAVPVRADSDVRRVAAGDVDVAARTISSRR